MCYSYYICAAGASREYSAENARKHRAGESREVPAPQRLPVEVVTKERVQRARSSGAPLCWITEWVRYERSQAAEYPAKTSDGPKVGPTEAPINCCLDTIPDRRSARPNGSSA
ncbi:MAG: hypothetical protein ABSH34_34755 [Verrucomicrobiota bacterium]